MVLIGLQKRRFRKWPLRRYCAFSEAWYTFGSYMPYRPQRVKWGPTFWKKVVFLKIQTYFVHNCLITSMTNTYNGA